MKRLPRNRVIETVLQEQMDTIENWVLRDKVSLKYWLLEVLDLKRMKTDEIMEEYSAFFPNEEDWSEDDPEERK